MIIMYTAAAIGAVSILCSHIKSGRFFVGILLSALQGVATLYGVNLIGCLLNVHVNVNAFSLIFSAVTSAPGVILLLIADIFI